MSCLVTRGYAGTTTAAIAELAGLSQGAMFNHFPTKEDLLAAVVEEYYSRGVEGATALMTVTTNFEMPMSQVVDFVFAAYDIPEALAIQELYVASRVSPRLREACSSVYESINQRTIALAGALFPDLAKDPRFADVVAMFSATVRGASIVRAAFGAEEIDQRTRRGLSAVLEVMVETVRGSRPQAGPEGAPEG